MFNAIKALVPHEARLELYQVHAVTEGTDAQAEVSVRLGEDGNVVTGKAADPDTLVASARAYVGALNKLMAKRDRRTDARKAAAARPRRCGGICTLPRSRSATRPRREFIPGWRARRWTSPPGLC